MSANNCLRSSFRLTAISLNPDAPDLATTSHRHHRTASSVLRAGTETRLKRRDIDWSQLRLRHSRRYESGDSVVIDVLANGPTLRQTSYAIIFPLVGVLLLAFGIRRRVAWRRWNGGDNDRLLVPRFEAATPEADANLRADRGELAQSGNRLHRRRHDRHAARHPARPVLSGDRARHPRGESRCRPVPHRC